MSYREDPHGLKGQLDDMERRLRAVELEAVLSSDTGGPSAYDIAVANGFVGSETAWLTSLAGGSGKGVLSSTSAPTSSSGVDGDFWINTTTWRLYGPKVSGAWPAGVALIGPAGVDGKTVLSGVIAPTAEGVDGDFYIDTVAKMFYGPKASGVWPAGFSLVGPSGGSYLGDPAALADDLMIATSGGTYAIKTAAQIKTILAVAMADVVGLSAALASLQPLDSDLTAIAALSTTTFGRALLTLVDAAAGRSALALGTAATSATTDFDATGDASAAQTAAEAFATAAIGALGLGSASTHPASDFAETANNLSDLANAGTARGNLGLGTASTHPSTDFVLATEVGAAGGVASLDGGGKVPVSQLPNSIMEYQGTWNASTNTPGLADGAGHIGDVYRVTVAGTQNLGSGSITYAVSDYVILNSALVWEKADTTDAVASIFGRTGNVVAADGDYSAAQVTFTDSGLTVITGVNRVQAALGAVDAALAARVLSTRNINSGTGLAGGGDLSADRTLSVLYGTTAGTSIQGNDASVTNARTPTPHAASHASGGSDAVTLAESQVTNLTSDLAAKAPTASPTFTGTVSGVTATMVGAPSGSGTSSGTNTGDQTLSGLGGVPTSRQVNGHPLSADVTVSASDITTGTLPTAQVPSLPASQITSGTIATARLGTGSAVAGSYVDGGTQAWTALPAKVSLPDGKVGDWRSAPPQTAVTSMTYAGSTANAATFILFTPIIVDRAATFSAVGLHVVTPATDSGSVFELGWCASDASGLPVWGSITSFGTVSATAAASDRTIGSLALTLQPGLYWLASCWTTSTTAGTNPAVSGMTSWLGAMDIDTLTDNNFRVFRVTKTAAATITGGSAVNWNAATLFSYPRTSLQTSAFL